VSPDAALDADISGVERGRPKFHRGLRERYRHTDEEHLKADQPPFHAILPQRFIVYSIEPSKAIALTCIKAGLNLSRPDTVPEEPTTFARSQPADSCRRCLRQINARLRRWYSLSQASSVTEKQIMKVVSVEEAVAMIPDGASVMIGGFMAVGTPERLLDELVRQRKSNLFVIANDAALPGKGIGKLVDAGLVTRMIASHIGLNPKAQQQMMAQKMAIDLVPQGTLVERIRAGGCGLGGILTPTGVGTTVEQGKQKIEVAGKTYLLETALRADFALVHSFLADYLGNLQYALTARNFNPVMAMAADTVLVTAENIVPVGVIAPDHVVTPGPLVDYLVANG
jgi:acetate CoA/acetoacetate CoA-transferase alpha subunit